MGNAREEALAAIAERFAREEERWRRDNPGKVRFYLIHAPDEPPTFSAEGQSALWPVASALREHHIDADMPVMALDSVDAHGGYTGEIAVLLSAVSPVLTGILCAWLQSKAGRKLRLKVGDAEVEAGTVKEVDQLLERARELQARQERSEKKDK